MVSKNNSNKNQKVITVLVQDLSEAPVPGFPSPLTGSRFEALKKKISVNGVLKPLLVDENNYVWDGRSRLRACKELSVTEVIAIRISSSDGPEMARAAMMQRQWTPVEMAETIFWVQEQEAELTAFKVEEVGRKTNHYIGRWMATELGMVRGVSPRQVTGYLKLAKAYHSLESDKDRAAVEDAGTLNEALRLLPRDGKKSKQKDPLKLCQNAMGRLVKMLKKHGRSDAVEDAIRQIMAAVNAAVPSSIE